MNSTTEPDSRDPSAGVLGSNALRIAAIGLGTASTQLDTAVNIAFPAITQRFDLAIGDIQWVVICYVLVYASLLLALGRIGDTIGHAIVYRTGLILSAVSFLLVGLAPSYGAMLLFRCSQGVGAALVLSCGAALMTRIYGEARRSSALGVYTMIMALGLALGPLLGGALVAVWDWPAVFWFRAPIAVAALLLSSGLPRSQPHAPRDPFDIPGAVALTLGLSTMLIAFNRMREPQAVPLALVSAAALAGFVFRQSRAERPIINFAIFRLPGFALLNIVSVTANLAAFSVWLLVPYYFTRMTRYSLAESGAVLASGAAGVVLASPIGGRLIGETISAGRMAVAGSALVSAGLLLLGEWTEQTPTMLRVGGLLVQGIGLGLFQVAYADIVTAALPPADRGVAGSLALLTRMLGTVAAASLVLMVFEGFQITLGFTEAFRKTLRLASLLAFASAGLLVLSPRNVGKS